MKQIIIVIGIILLVANLLFGLILSSYEVFNLFVSSLVIVATTALLFCLNVVTLKDGFKISLHVLFPILGGMEFVLSLFSTKTFENNWFLLVIVLSLAVQSIILVVIHKVPVKIK